MKTIQILFLLFFASINANAQYRGLFIPDVNGGTSLASNEKRIALVIGNKSYRNGWSPLSNTVNDANTMTAALQDCGFEVTTVTDANRSQFLDAIRNFKGKIQGNATVALFFYAGHGLEESGQNYLVPMDDASKCRNEIEDNGIKLSSIQKQLKDAGAAMSIMIVDACRNQPLPFTCAGSYRGGTSSTFTEFKAKGSYIAFSTAPGQTAADGNRGSNSPYTAALSKAIRQEGLKIEDVFKQVRRDLDQIGQETWDNNGYSGDFYFKYKTKRDGPQDSDDDGIIDSRDQCPYERGEISNNGCPKTATVEDAAEITENVAGISFTMRTVKSGTFKMGSSDSEASSDETPHTVILSKNFRLAEYEVTIEQFRAFIESTSYKTDAEKEGYSWKFTDKWEKMENINWRHDCQGNTRSYTEYNHPVIHVSWNDAVAYCKWLSEKTGKSYRLPTEAEWEYAAGNGSKHTKYSWGNGSPTNSKGGNVTDESKNPVNGNVWVTKFDAYNDGYWFTAPVGQYGANDLGLFDMTGNVWEWCADYCDYIDSKVTTDTYKDGATNPLCKSGSYRVIRGGGWNSVPTGWRVANRDYSSPTNRYGYVGFRVALSE